jgi:pyruvate formate lyase activating enzyme
MQHPARFWKEVAGGVVCQLCPHACQLIPGETGLCRTRINEGGVLMTLAHGNPVALHVDPVEKKPLYHFFPGSRTFSMATRGCNLRCLNCQNYTISQTSPSLEDCQSSLPDDLVFLAQQNHCHSISFTYTDPVAFYEYATDTAWKARDAGLHNILVSAGYISPKPLAEWCRVMDAANIDLKVFDDAISRKLNGIRLAPVLKSLVALKRANVWLEITNLLIPGWTDSPETIEKMCLWLVENGFSDTPFHFSRFYPTHKLQDTPQTPLATIEMACDIARSTGILFVYSGNVPGHDSDNTFCPACNKKIIERQGYTLSGYHLKNGCCGYCGKLISGRFK